MTLGKGVRFGKGVRITGARVKIGDGCIIGDRTLISASDFEMGDFGTIYPDCFFPGPGKIRIGHNFWLGNGAIVDAMGGTTIGDNVGVGAGSQLWSHMKFADVMMGSRFHSERPLEIENDAWLVGHCLVSPVRIGARSVAMFGALVTKDVPADTVVSGVPAKDSTPLFGPPFQLTSAEVRAAWLLQRLADLEKAFGARILDRTAIVIETGGTSDSEFVFNVADRTYRKRGTKMERRIIRALLPDAKFVPRA